MLPAGTPLRRVYCQGPPHGRQWQAFRCYGPLPGARFDHHEGPPRAQTRGILYGAPETATCLAEVFQQTRTINRSRRSPFLVVFELTRDVTLLDLCGEWPTRAGASQVINSGPRDRARAWSASVYDAYPVIEGLLYRSSMRGGARAVALYDRAQDALPSHPSLRPPPQPP